MRKNFKAQPILYPQPVFIIATYNEDGTPNAMNAAWGGVSGGSEIFICLGAGHKTANNIMSRRAFTVSMADIDHLEQCDYVGITSANDVPDKFERAGFHAVKSEFTDAPIIEELPLTLECTLVSYDPSTGHLFGKIENVCADERILTDGKVDPAKLRPLTYDHVNHVYLAVGEKAGNAFSSGLAIKNK